MNEEKINEYVDRTGVEQDTQFMLKNINDIFAAYNKLGSVRIGLNGISELGKVNGAAKESASALDVYDKAIQRVEAQMASMNGQNKEFNQNVLLSVKASKEAAAAKLNEAKVITETAKAQKIESDAAAKSAAATERQARAAAANNEPYKQLVIRFTAAANEARNLAAKYGITDQRARDAAAGALVLNNQLKAIDSSIGNHQRNVGNYSSAIDHAKDKLKEFGNIVLGFVGITAGIEFLKGSVDAFLELDKAERILQNTTKNLGVPELFSQIKDQTEKLTKQFRFLKEEDVASTFNKLLVYGKLSKNQIDELIPVIINFATATGKDLPEATGTILKAFEGNNRALKEFGINIKEGKDVTERFGIIMDQLAPRVANVGEEFQKSAAGGIAVAREEFRKLKETIGAQLTPALSGLLSWFSNVITGLGYLKDKFIETGQEIFDFFGGIQGAANAAIRDAERQRQAVGSAAKLLIEDLAGKGITDANDQVVELNQQLLNMSNLLKAAKANKTGTFTTDDLKKYKTGIDVIKTALKDVFKVTAAGDPNKPIGLGNPDAVEKEKKTIEDFGKDLAKVQADIAKNNFELLKQRLQDQITADQEIVNDDKKGYNERLRASQDYYDKQQQLADISRDYELQANADAIKEEKRQVELKLNKKDLTTTQRQDLNDELLELTEKEKSAEVLINAKHNSEMVKNNSESEKQITSILKFETDKRKKLREDDRKAADVHGKSQFDINREDIQNAFDQQLTLLEKNLNKGEISQKTFDKRKLALNAKLQIDLLKNEINYTNSVLDEQKARFDADEAELQHKIDIAKAEAALETDPIKKKDKLAGIAEAEHQLTQTRIADNDIVIKGVRDLSALRIKLSALFTKTQKEENDSTLESFDKTFGKIVEIAKQTFDFIGGIVAASIDKQKNAVQGQIDALDKQKEKDIEVANQTITNATDRANAIAVIEARAAAKKEALDRRQRQLDQERAKFEKAANIAGIILETAKAVVHELATGDPYTAFARALTAGVIGAAQLAVAIATPIPKYDVETSDHPGGPAIVAERRPEVVTKPSGKSYLYNKPTLIPGLEKHSTVYHWDKVVDTAMHVTHRGELKTITTPSNDYQFQNVTEEIKAMKNDVVRAIKTKKEFHLNADESGMTALWKHQAGSIKYIQDQTNW